MADQDASDAQATPPAVPAEEPAVVEVDPDEAQGKLTPRRMVEIRDESGKPLRVTIS
jgi:hypothetical protein